MFKGMKPVFWWGLALLYGYPFLMMILEMNIPGLTYHVKIGNAPLSFLYAHVIALLVVPMTVAILYWYVIEQEEKKSGAQTQGVKKNG